MTVTRFATVFALLLLAGTPAGAAPAKAPAALTRPGLPHRTVEFTAADDAPLTGWWFPARDSGAVVVVCPRREGTMADLLPIVHEFSRQDLSVFTFDYRDLGPGGPRDADSLKYVVFASRWVDDAVAASREARRLAPGRHVFLWGQDVGGAVAVAAGARDRDVADGVICESLFRSSFDQLARNGTQQIPGVNERQRALIFPPDEPISSVPRLTVPLLVFVLGKDTVVPVKETNDVTRRSRSLIDKEQLPASGHAGAEQSLGYFERIASFIRYIGSLGPPRVR